MANEKINQLKDKLRDKNLTRAQRQAIMEEIAEESHKTDTRKPMTLYKYRLLHFWGFFLSFVTKVFDMITTACGVDDNVIVSIITLMFSVPSAIFLILWLVATFSRKIDREDEMAKENLNKARQGISVIVMTTLLVLMSGVVIIGSFLDIDFTLTLHRNNLYDIIILILWGYFSLESGLFLMFEGKCSYDDEEESEEE
ncbi:MAG: hypothetical protein E7500_03005 [Ruminococcus sp.]|nr:hypothetical protein [Ruminococcus sp.]